MNPRILVLGATGMLGSMVFRVLNASGGLNVTGTSLSPEPAPGHMHFAVEKFVANPASFVGELEKFDYVVNCIGITKPHCADNDMSGVQRAILVNSLFPHVLGSSLPGTRIIQISTDGVFSENAGECFEDTPTCPGDAYGKTKSLGEVHQSNFLNIRCSILGPEIEGRKSLLEWFLAQGRGATVNGFTNCMWNGVTTVQFAKLCYGIITGNWWDSIQAQGDTHHYVPNAAVSKFELLELLNRAFGRECKVLPVIKPHGGSTRILGTRRSVFGATSSVQPMNAALDELAAVCSETGAV